MLCTSFVRNANNWSPSSFVKSSGNNVGSLDHFGNSASLSGDGNTLAVGARGEDSSTSGINTSPNNFVRDTGAAYVFTTRSSQNHYLKAGDNSTGTNGDDFFGESVSLSFDGDILAVGASGVGETAAYVFSRNAGTWSQMAHLKGGYYGFGKSLALSSDSNTLAVGDWLRGAVYLY